MKTLHRLASATLAAVLVTAPVATAQTNAAAKAAPSANAAAAIPSGSFDEALRRAESLPGLKTLLVAQDGRKLVEEGFHGANTARSTNIKSASKSIVSALVGVAIDKGLLKGPDQPIAEILRSDFPKDADPRLERVTIGQLLSMQAGLERTSGANYGAWISSRNWVRDALARPFVEEPGGPMLYSTGSTHLLSAILTKVSGRSTLQLAREWLGPAGVEIASWERDPQGIYLGGNQMAMTPRSLLAFGEIYRRGGLAANGTRILSQAWIERSWTPRTTSRFHDGRYGYGWFIDDFGGRTGYYGWGYGGQMIYVFPDLALTVAITSDETQPSGRSGYVRDLHRLVTETVLPPAEALQRAGGTG
ncbi:MULTISPECIES: serine hydrolase domain-containing protein [unclassified Aureimonas]|uniref:serine hydrolase domain-containing protein n=1 Tax=unclassified Aureimonas TaxID=2615206 RepID=UPI0006FA69CB|nr:MULTISPECIES: serine hydrolase [unclassified Aureimonas]KQT55146.1 6-aminohexanoate hydrolase [Aureimonas sp. Leaf427]KQT70935.1 6-aminohexanoate hydrolase [Aureimonas sp. Leaf460]